MKKLLSVILAVSMIMSLICVVPASAANAVWPYFFEDFEGDTRAVNGVTTTEGGADGSANSATIVSKAWMNSETQMYSNNFSLGYVYGWLYSGDTVTISYDIKLAQPIESGVSTLYMHYLGASGSSQYNSENFESNGYVVESNNSYPKPEFDNTSTEWQNASRTFVYTGLDVFIDGSAGVNVRIPFDAENQSALIDNVEFKIVRNTQMDPVPATRVIYENDFSEAMTGITYKGTTAAGSGLSLITPEDAETEGTGQVLQMTDTDTRGHVKFDLDIGESLEYNKRYLITFKARTVEAFDNSSGEAVAFAENPGSKHRWSTNSSHFWELANMPNNNVWQDCALSLYMTNDAGGVYDDGIITMQWWIKYQGSGSDTGTYQFDDIVIREVGGIYNGDFDDFRNFKNLFYKEVSAVNTSGGSSLTLETEWKTLTNARLGAFNTSSLVSEPHSRTMYFDAIDGTASMARQAYLEAGQKYEFSAKIDPAGTNSCGTLKVSMNYTYADGTEANSVDIVSMAPTARGYKEYSAEFTTPENMLSAELVVTELGTGADVSRFTTSGNLAYYADDWIITKLPSADIPVVSASAATSADAIVTVSKTFTAPEGVTDASVIKLTATKDGVKTYIGSTTDTVITVPESYRTGYTLAAEIIPVGSNGYVGKVVTIEVPEVPVVVGTTFTATAADGATLTSSEALSGEVIWAAFDANGKMIDWATAKIAVDPAVSTTANAPVPAEFDATGAEEVKVMLWNSWSECKAIADAITY